MKSHLKTVFALFLLMLFLVNNLNAQKKEMTTFESDISLSGLMDVLKENVKIPAEYDTPLKAKSYLNTVEGRNAKSELAMQKKKLLKERHYLKATISLASYSVKNDGFFINLYQICPTSRDEQNRFINEEFCISKFLFNQLPIGTYEDGFCILRSLKIKCPENIAAKLEKQEVEFEISFYLTGKIKDFFYEDKVLNYFNQTFSYSETENVEISFTFNGSKVFTKKYK